MNRSHSAQGKPPVSLSDPHEMALLLRLPGNGRNLAVEREGPRLPGSGATGTFPPRSVVLSSSKAAPHPTSELTRTPQGGRENTPLALRRQESFPPSSAGPGGRQPTYHQLHGILSRVLTNLRRPLPASPTLLVSWPFTSQTPRIIPPPSGRQREEAEAHRLRRPES